MIKTVSFSPQAYKQYKRTQTLTEKALWPRDKKLKNKNPVADIREMIANANVSKEIEGTIGMDNVCMYKLCQLINQLQFMVQLHYNFIYNVHA